jgi:Resolvase, N terminal domain/Recombinase
VKYLQAVYCLLMKAAYSYKRFSSAAQTDGDSLERQMQIARDWYYRQIAHLGIPLDETFTDSGVSAFTGKHIGKRGNLGRFLAAIQSGAVSKGSILIAENLDRISRQGPKVARKLLEQIVDNGVDVHVVNIDKKLTYGWENRNEDSIIVDVELSRAFKESERKSQLVGAALGKKKLLESWTTTAPFWIKKSNGGFAVIPEKVKLVKEVFRLALLGLGAKRITRALPEWEFSIMTVTRTLRNRAVLGEHEVNGEPIKKWPRIIDQQVFDKAQKLLNAKNSMCSDGNIRPHTGARNSDEATNLFQGLIYDVTDSPKERPMYYRGPDSQRHKAALISKFNPDHKGHSIQYEPFETAFIQFLNEQNWREIAGQKETPELGIARNKLNTVLAEIDRQERLIARRTSDMENPDLPSQEVQLFSAIIVKAQRRLASLMQERSHLQARISQEESKADALYHPEEMLALLGSGKVENRLRARNEIRKRVSRIMVDLSGDLPLIHVRFVNGEVGLAIIRGDIAILLKFDKGAIPTTLDEWAQNAKIVDLAREGKLSWRGNNF